LIVSRRTTTGRRRLGGADERYVYVELTEALVLFAEIKGLSVAAARSELRDEGLLESALNRPRNAARYEDSDLAYQAAVLLCGIAQNQPFVDGNKRIAVVVALTFLELNDHITDLTEEALYELMIDVSSGLAPADVANRLRPRLTRIQATG
jgi:death on curing protein